MNRLTKTVNKLILIAIVFVQIFVVLFMFVGCRSSEYDQTALYAEFEDNLGNKHKVQGAVRGSPDNDFRIFSSSVKLDLNPDVDYTFTGGLYYMNSGKKVVVNDFIKDIVGLSLVSKNYYLGTGYCSFTDFGCIETGESITLSGAEKGTYTLVLFTTYTFDNYATADYYFLTVYIG